MEPNFFSYSIAKYIVEVKVVEYDQWLEILSKVNINESNIIDKIKEELKEKDLDTY
ncbi:hypothetical protein [Wolbachia endosymbiont of Tettigetta isshikii]|uniref:hypothetical protein n=1 Tax=Wolbachia endosymbiont of Tettigetta isshikii TaxID=3239093 RepID=UPI0039810FC6